MFQALIVLIVVSASGMKSFATGTFPDQFTSRDDCQEFADTKLVEADAFLPDGAYYEMLEIQCEKDTRGLDA